MDVHRSRFVEFPPSAINALAFSHPSNHETSDEDVRLAVGRANGDIEIWNPLQGAWVQETMFRGGKDRSVEDLAWIQEPDDVSHDSNAIKGRLRLFSIGYNSSVTEWNLATGLPARHSGGTSSEVWCMAAQPPWQAAEGKLAREGEWTGQNLIAGCADGTLVLLGTEENELQFKRYVSRADRKSSRCLSVTWQTRDIVVSGFADSHIRIFDARAAQLLRTISLGGGPIKGPRDILVWSVKCLSNGDIVSGDSTGDVRIYDGKYFSQTQRMSGHETDCLAVAVSHDGQTIFSTGPDRRLAIYRLGGASEGSKRRFWAKLSHQRHHSHDAKTLAIYESAQMSTLASGGVDTSLIIHPVRGHNDEYSRTISGLPQRQHILTTRNRLLISWWDREISVWQFQRGSSRIEPHKLLTKVHIKGEASITSTSLSADASVLAVATSAEVRLFSMRLKGVQPAQTLRIRKIESPKTLQGRGGQLVQLSKDGKWLAVVRRDSEIQVYRLVRDDVSSSSYRINARAQELPRESRKRPESSLGRYDRTVTRISFSDDGHALIVSDLSGCIESWLLAGHEDTTAPEADVVGEALSDDSEDEEDEESGQKIVFFGQYWARNPSGRLLPKLDAAPLILTFRPSTREPEHEPNGNPAVHATRHNPHPIPHDMPQGPYNLVLITARHQLFEFDLLNGQMTKWSRRNPPSILPASFTSVRDRVVGAFWHVTTQVERLWLYGTSWVYMFDLAQDLDSMAESDSTNGEHHTLSKKRKREKSTKQSQRGTSGAGSRKKARDLEGLSGEAREINVEGSRGEDFRKDPDEDEDEDDGIPETLRTFDDSDNDAAQPMQDVDQAKPSRAWTWHTFKYRPILGIAPLSDEVDLENEGEAALEVALIERPPWDLDLPEPFVGVHER